MRPRLRLLLLDDHALFREGIESIIAVRMPEAILHSCARLEMAEAALSEELPDLVLLDIDLGPVQGFEVLTRWRRARPGMPIAMLSASTDPADMAHALDLGARGFIPKTCSGSLLVAAIELIAAGGTYVPPEMLASSALRSQRSTGSSPAADSVAEHGLSANLTPRQFDVLALLAEGQSNKTIGRRLDMADGTVRTHINAIFRLLDANNRTQAVMRAQQLGWL